MSDYKVTDTELISVANAIRTKGGTQAQLEWPSGFVSAIGSISGGGGSDGIFIENNDHTLGIYISDSEVKAYFMGYTKTTADDAISNIDTDNTLIELLRALHLPYSDRLVYTRAYTSDKTTNNGYIGFYHDGIRSWEDDLRTSKAGTFWAVIDFLNSTIEQHNQWEEPPIVASL